MNFRLDVYVHMDGDTELRAALHRIEGKVDGLLTKEDFMATMQQVLDDLDTIKQEAGDYIAARDAIDVDLRAQIAALTAANPAVQAQVDAAFQKAEDAKALLAAPGGGGGSLATTFPDVATFDAAVLALPTGGQAVTLDSGNIHAGSTPSLDYFSHPDGHVDMTPEPTAATKRK